jgi:hypothetical protein
VKSQIRLIRTVKHKSTRGPAYPSKERRGSKPHADKSSICRVSNQHRTLASLTRKGSRALGLGDEIFAGRCTIVSLPTYIGIVECVAPTSPHSSCGKPASAPRLGADSRAAIGFEFLPDVQGCRPAAYPGLRQHRRAFKVGQAIGPVRGSARSFPTFSNLYNPPSVISPPVRCSCARYG